MPRVSIITPLHNGAEFINECMDSVQAQSYADYEHLIIDNRSTDRGPEYVAERAENDPRIKLLSNEVAAGAAPTRNVGLATAQGKYAAFLDCDDAWLPEKLERQIAIMEQRRLAFSWTAYKVVDQNGAELREQRVSEAPSFHDILLKRTTIGCLTAVIDLEAIGPVAMPQGDIHEDFCLWIDILNVARSKGLGWAGIDTPLARYRVHQGGKSANKLAAMRMHWRSCRNHLGLSLPVAGLCFASYASNALKDRAR